MPAIDPDELQEDQACDDPPGKEGIPNDSLHFKTSTAPNALLDVSSINEAVSREQVGEGLSERDIIFLFHHHRKRELNRRKANVPNLSANPVVYIGTYTDDRTTGLLTYRHHTPTGGREPRNFAIDPTGSFLLAANQKSHNIVMFRIDTGSGELSRTGHEVEISMPVCVKFNHWNSP
jgi:hypothetical protein